MTRENQHVKMGAFHTLDLEGAHLRPILRSRSAARELTGRWPRSPANRDFDIWKKDGWDSVALERIDDATQEGRGAEVGAIILGEGTAAVCLLTEHMMVVRQRIDVPVPRKRKGQSGVHEKVRTHSSRS